MKRTLIKTRMVTLTWMMVRDDVDEDDDHKVEDMGDALLPINFGPNRYGMKITASEEHTCAILDDFSLR